MKLQRSCLLVLPLLVLPLLAVSARADTLGAASTYGALATTQVTDASLSGQATVVTGNMGAVSCTSFVPGVPDSCTLGFGTVSGATNLAGGSGNAAYLAALAASNHAYTALQTTPFTTNEGGANTLGNGLGGTLPSLGPGVYQFTGSVTNLIGTLTLNGGGDPNALWIFQIASTPGSLGALVTAPNSSVVVTGVPTGGNPGVYWVVGTQATLGVDTAFVGNTLAGTSVVFDLGAQDTCGGAYTDTAAGTAVTFAGEDTTPTSLRVNKVGNSNCNGLSGLSGGTITPGGVAPTPEPTTLLLLGTGIAGLAGKARMRRAKARRA